MIKYTYKIQKLHANPVTGIINTVEWWFIGTENKFSYKVYQVSTLPEPKKNTIIDTKHLTEEVVVKWIKSSLTKEQLNNLKSIIINDIERQKNPDTVAINHPWLEN